MKEESQAWQPISVIDKATGAIVKIKDYKFNPNLHEHIEEAKGVKEVMPEVATEETPEVGPLVCVEHNKTFKREQDLKTHMKKFHN